MCPVFIPSVSRVSLSLSIGKRIHWSSGGVVSTISLVFPSCLDLPGKQANDSLSKALVMSLSKKTDGLWRRQAEARLLWSGRSALKLKHKELLFQRQLCACGISFRTVHTVFDGPVLWDTIRAITLTLMPRGGRLVYSRSVYSRFAYSRLILGAGYSYHAVALSEGLVVFVCQSLSKGFPEGKFISRVALCNNSPLSCRGR